MSKKSDWQKKFTGNWKFMLVHMDAVKEIVLKNLPLLVDIVIASPQKDLEEATDLILSLQGGDIAVRVRRKDCLYRDWTVRSELDWADRTEIDKLREGFGDWYFYGWSQDNKGKLSEWIIIDLKKVREIGLLDMPKSDIPNGDGTWFRAYSIADLEENGCLIAQGQYVHKDAI